MKVAADYCDLVYFTRTVQHLSTAVIRCTVVDFEHFKSMVISIGMIPIVSRGNVIISGPPLKSRPRDCVGPPLWSGPLESS